MIEKHTDPKTRKEYLLATGKVDGVFFNELKQKKTYAGPNGPWTPTHSINLVVDGARISLGLTEKDTLRAKDVNDQYQDVARGAEVSVVVEEGSEYKGVMQYNSRASQITVIEPAPVQQAPTPGQKPDFSAKKRDNTGVETGHAINGGLNLVRGNLFDGDAVEAAKFVHTLTTQLKAEYAKKNPDMSEYDIGAMVGNAVLNATRDANKVEEVEYYSRDLLDNVVPDVSVFVKTSKETPKEEEKKVTAKRTPRKNNKDVVKKEEEVVVDKETTDDDRFDGNPDFDDDDVPF